MTLKLMGKLIINGKIECKTGLHIGGMQETLKIGGSDTPVIKDKNGKVYIPGSSLKGKIRSLLEIKDGKYISNGKDAEPCNCAKTNCHICMLFGPHKSEDIKEPPRVILRDAYLLLNNKYTYDYLETKPENAIDRVKGTALSPRFIERVTAGSEFEYEVIFNIYKKEDLELVKTFLGGMKLLEDDYLGGSGSRGYGKIIFKDLMVSYRSKKYYEGEAHPIAIKNIKNINTLSKSGGLDKIFEKIN